MKKTLLILVALAALAAPVAASAHPLGNFTTNRYSELHVSGHHLYVLYVLDLAEIPTFQAKDEVASLGRDGYARELARKIARGARLEVNGRARPLRAGRSELAFPLGVAGLHTTRLEVVLDGGMLPKGAPALVRYRDTNWSGRIGWVEVVLQADHGAGVRASSVSAHTISDQLRAYPKNLLQSPLHVSAAQSRVVAGTEAGVAPALTSERNLRSPVRVASRTDTGFASLVARTRLNPGIILVAVLLAMFWGAAHALTPGHGKTIVAAYLVGSRGNARHALLLGLIVTFTHTLGVFALGLVTLALSEFVVPEQLYPWLNLMSALLVVGVGLAVLRSRVTGWRTRGRAKAHHHHDHAHAHGHTHGHDHEHLPEPGSGLRGLVAVGISGGLLPCPTALVVLLAAISLHRIGYGLLLIVAFSAGLAGTISAIGLLAVGAKRTFRRVSFEGTVIRALPAVSALVVLGLGVAMTVRALPKLT